MPSLSKKDRVSLCSFTFSDGRRCRTPRAAKHPHFCFYHPQKEARARAAKKLGKDLAFFFSGDYVSGCDLSTALARLIPAVVRGDVKPRTASTVAYLAQTLMQAIHIGQHEYINAFGSDGWRKSIRNSVNGNYNYRFPPAPQPEQHVVAGLQTGTPPPQPSSCSPSSPPAESPQPQPAAQPVEMLANCHSERSEESAFSEPQPAPPHPACHPERTEASQPIPAAPADPPTTPLPTPPPTPNRNASLLHFDHNYRLRIDGKPF